MPRPGHAVGPHSRLELCSMTRIAPAVTKMLSSAAGTSHFQAKPISWSMRTRGRVPRMSTKNSDSVNLDQEPEQAR